MDPPPTPIADGISPTQEANPPTQTSPPTPRPADLPVQYRIEEHRRTIYLTSSLPPGEWDSKALNELLSLPEVPDEMDGLSQRQRRAKSLNENDLMVFKDNSNQKSKDSPSNSPRTFRPARNLGIPKGGGSSSTPATPTVAVRSGLPRTPTRHRILFYHRQDPHYGFTNFSAHPVVYNGKRYPTSEHLFQSFKVKHLLLLHHINQTFPYSFKSIAPILRSISEHVLRGRVLPFHKHVDSNPKSDPIG